MHRRFSFSWETKLFLCKGHTFSVVYFQAYKAHPLSIAKHRHRVGTWHDVFFLISMLSIFYPPNSHHIDVFIIYYIKRLYYLRGGAVPSHEKREKRCCFHVRGLVLLPSQTLSYWCIYNLLYLETISPTHRGLPHHENRSYFYARGVFSQ